MADKPIVHDWPPLSSDPVMFGKLAEFLGVETYTVNEVWGFDPELLAFLPQPCLGAIGLFMRLDGKRDMDKARGDPAVAHTFYMDQSGTLDNACGIIALIHAVLNCPQIPVRSGSPLDGFRQKALAEGSSPASRCAELEGSTEIHDFYKTIQQSGVGPEDGQEERVAEDGQVQVKTFHFVAYVRNDQGQLIELDGTKQGPWVVADGVPADGLMEAVATEMKRRVAEEEIDGTEMAVMAIGPPAM